MQLTWHIFFKLLPSIVYPCQAAVDDAHKSIIFTNCHGLAYCIVDYNMYHICMTSDPDLQPYLKILKTDSQLEADTCQ